MFVTLSSVFAWVAGALIYLLATGSVDDWSLAGLAGILVAASLSLAVSAALEGDR